MGRSPAGARSCQTDDDMIERRSFEVRDHPVKPPPGSACRPHIKAREAVAVANTLSAPDAR